MENNNGSSGRSTTAIAFLIGVVAGGITALLFAPQTGAEMRGQIKRGARNVRQRGENLAHDMQDRAGNMKGAASEARIAYRDEMEKRRMSPRSAVVEKGEQT
jgi:gas vesicle protein